MSRPSLLVVSPVSLAVNRAKACDYDAHHHLGFFPLASRTTTACTSCASSTSSASSGPASRPGFAGPGHHTHDLGMAHFEVAGAVGSGLGPNLGVDSPQLIPASAIDAEQGEFVCRCVERHDEIEGLFLFPR